MGRLKNHLQAAFLGAAILLHAPLAFTAPENPYFPPAEGAWEIVSPAGAGWNAGELDAAMAYAGAQHASGVVVLYRGRILAERYWQPKRDADARPLYDAMLIETTPDGRCVEDVASVQKSVVSFLAAVARDRGKLDIDATVTRYLGDGWSKATPEQEARITVRHLMAMTSGLDDRLDYAHAAGTVWKYGTGPYSVLIPVLEKAAGEDIRLLTREWLTAPAGMRESRWEQRQWTRNPAAAPIGFVSSARDLARFGLLVLSAGQWGGHALLENPEYLSEALQPSQGLQPAYGLLWWLTGPGKTVAALGALSRLVLIVPEKKTVVVRLGDRPGDGDREFRRKFFQMVRAAMPQG